MSLRDIVKEYIDRGWSPIPIKERGKEPSAGKGWQKLRIHSKEDIQKWFKNDKSNIGVLLGGPSGGLTDFDLNCPEAIKFAPDYLPNTLRFGRKTAPDSHWEYITDYKTVDAYEFQEGPKDERRILEIRGSGQTVFPGSIHKDTGEQIEFTNPDQEPVEISFPELQSLARKIAASCILFRKWNKG